MVRNWAQYETGLRWRGDVTIWLSDEAIKSWKAPITGKPGGQKVYSDVAIEAAVTARMVFRLPLRQTEGFLRSLATRLAAEHPRLAAEHPGRKAHLRVPLSATPMFVFYIYPS